MSSTLTFPDHFVWGASTAAYQIEGAWNVAGKGESIWDRFSHTPGKIDHGDTGDVACDHYHRWREDIRVMQQLGLTAYRFSISWPRIYPAGRGTPNRAGLDFYARLIDGLLAANIQPFVTLYHWDLPQALQDLGGWLNRDTAYAFAEYTETVVKQLGDRVQFWATFNEPWCVAFMGHAQGVHAPGLRDKKAALQAAHHTLVAHGLGVQALRAVRANLQAGIVLNLWSIETPDEAPADPQVVEREWQRQLGWFLDPLLRAEYPSLAWQERQDIAPEMQPDDLPLAAQPLDFLGVNNYDRALLDNAGRRIKPVPGSEHTTLGWEVHAPALRRLLNRLRQRYPVPPLYITENGAAFPDVIDQDGRVHDPRRIAYLHDYLAQVWEAIQDGVDVRGYYVWSLLDNFEWAFGYDKRFGLTYVDYATQQRIIKDSGRWYAQVIAHNGLIE